jgi:ribonuclease HI
MPVKLFTGHRADYPINITTLAPQHVKKSSSSGSAGKAYSYLSLLDGVLVRHTDWASCQARVKGKAAQFRKTLSPTHEREIITEWGVADQLPG